MDMGMSSPSATRRHLIAAVVLCALAAAALYPFCGLVFGCGCTAMGLGGDLHCNVHRPWGPHCPWCEHPALGTMGLLLTLAGQGLVYVKVWRRARSAATAGAAAVLAFPLAALLAALVTWLPTDYPDFLGRATRRAWGLPPGPIRCVRPEPPPAAEAGGPEVPP
jgi:hypothetical protein